MSAHDVLRLRVLLAWAIEYVERQANVLEECSTDPDGNYDDDACAEEEVADCRRWLKEAREELGDGI